MTAWGRRGARASCTIPGMTFPQLASSARDQSFASGASATSFTGASSPRSPAPDLARGFMLLLIALANVPLWISAMPERAQAGAGDRAWLVLRTMLVDMRSYPLFAMLFGFGLAMMVRRRIAMDLRAAHEQVGDGLERMATGDRAQWEARVRERAAVDARRLVRRRGWWMILIGGVHALVFGGDFIAPYGVVAVLLAGLIAHRRRRAMVAACILLLAVAAVAVVALPQGLLVGEQGEPSAPWSLSVGMAGAALELGLGHALAQWALGVVVTCSLGLIMPSTLVGVGLAGTGLLTHPEPHRRVLRGWGAGALLIAALGALPIIPVVVEGREPMSNVPAIILAGISGMVGACGWLALLAAWAGPGPGGAPVRVRWLLMAVGKRSMTAYLGQTALFLTAFAALDYWGVNSLRQGAGAVMAVVVWAVMAAICAWMERSGRARGPFEALLRWCVSASAWRGAHAFGGISSSVRRKR